jgi:hypothetical protein
MGIEVFIGNFWASFSLESSAEMREDTPNQLLDGAKLEEQAQDESTIFPWRERCRACCFADLP